MLIAHMLYEMQHGVMTASDARHHALSKGFARTALYLDAKSVYAAVTATFIKTPAEKSLLTHVQFLREILDRGTLSAILWIDTRDMIADGLTKGAVGRELLQAAMDGLMTLIHEHAIWKPKLITTTTTAHTDTHTSPDNTATYNFVIK